MAEVKKVTQKLSAQNIQTLNIANESAQNLKVLDLTSNREVEMKSAQNIKTTSLMNSKKKS